MYTARDLTRWIRGIYLVIGSRETLSIEELVRVWAHEALRLFYDRLVDDADRRDVSDHIDSVALKHFPEIDEEKVLGRPILFSNWLSSEDYVPVAREELRRHVESRLKDFHEKCLDDPLVLFDDLLDHVIRIDHIFRQSHGHLVLIGGPGGGKKTLTRFVAWMNSLDVFQVKIHRSHLRRGDHPLTSSSASL